jgi:Tol biopolymer transport system component
MEATLEGVILGTAAYMSPEQAKGRAADKQTDIWAFGCVLFEMLTGKQAFAGEIVTEVIASILKGEPDWSLLPPSASHLKPVLMHCLEKAKNQRLRDIGDVRLLLQASENTAASALPAKQSTSRLRERVAWIIAALALIAGGIIFVRSSSIRDDTPQPGVRFTVAEPKDARFLPGPTEPEVAISPDGRWLVFKASKQGEPTTLWLRSMGDLESRQLAGTEAGNYPFWSPDSRFIGFYAAGKLKKIDILGGQPQTLTDSRVGNGTWGPDGTILWAVGGGGIMRVPSMGGNASSVVMPDASIKETSLLWPQFLPDGRHFVFVANADTGWTAYVGSLDSKERKKLLQADSKVLHIPGYLFFMRSTSLMVQPFDDRAHELKGDPFPAAENVGTFDNARAAFSVSASGMLVYRTSASGQISELAWFDRSGRSLGTVGMPANYQGIDLSPDGRWLAVHKHEAATGGGDIWVFDLVKSNLSRLTFEPARHYEGPIWSPDGTSVTYQAQRPPRVIYRKAANGAGAEEQLFQQPSDSADNVLPTGWTPDGKFLIYQVRSAKNGADIGLLPVTGDRKPSPYLETSFNEGDAQISPNQKWVAYSSNESGPFEIYVRPFPDAAGGKWQVSSGGGDFPRWRADSKELFFITSDRKLMAADVVERSGVPEIGVAHLLFETRISYPAGTADFYSYAVSRDGQRFIISSLPQDSALASEPMTVVLNWAGTLAKKGK